ncbi:uncharacterized protein LOC107478650 [Arachis duranensis]|uniref:ATP-dependent DNA helicase n=1 Tax=Arachis duranensis TaxID=130453 RepID=A0A6P4CPJ8_ARADU|nr:uncharacterized protein LOC107478650 [Arachis duranensis]
MPFPNLVDSIEPPDTFFFHELNFNKTELASISVNLVSRLNRDQCVAYDTIFNAVSRDICDFFFVYGSGGTRKTFLWNALFTSIRSKGYIVLNVASSGIVALFLPNRRTAHSRFKVPLNVNQDSISLDKCFKDVLHFDHGYNPNTLFGGKVVVLGSEFRQILPVIPRGSREEIVLQLTKNMRLGCDPQDIHNVQLEKFADWLLQIGDGLFGDSIDGESVIRIPDNLLLNIESPGLHDLVLFVYPDILLHTSSVDYFKDMSILAPTLDIVTKVNNHVMSFIPGNERVYLSSDTLLNEDGHLESELYTMSIKSLNALNCSGIPQHRLVHKIGVPIMLLRNIDQSNGLCNGTRMQVRRLGDHVIECIILASRNIGEVVFIPRMNLGRTLSTIDMYLPRPVFTHGQLYVALSRVNSYSGLKVLFAFCLLKTVVTACKYAIVEYCHNGIPLFMLRSRCFYVSVLGTGLKTSRYRDKDVCSS